MNDWVVFKHNEKVLLSYTVVGTFDGEAEDTVKLLATEYGIPEDEIEISIENRR